MKNLSKLSRLGIVMVFLGILCAISENIYYGGVSAEGVLEESFLLPLTFIFFAIGAVLFAAAGLISLLRKLK